MERKIIFFDIDGTLSDEQTFLVPESTIDAMTRAREAGHILMVNSGRTWCAIEQPIRSLPLDGFVCGCGTEIIYHGDSLIRHDMDTDFRKAIINDAFVPGLDPVLEGSNGVWFGDPIAHPDVDSCKAHYTECGLPVFTMQRGGDAPYEKFCIWYTDKDKMSAFRAKYEDRLMFIRRDDAFDEIIPRPYSKATGMREICAHLGIDKKDTYAIGDSMNDLTMLKEAGTSIAMGNGKDDIKALCDYVTTGINDDGIMNALRHFDLLN